MLTILQCTDVMNVGNSPAKGRCASCTYLYIVNSTKMTYDRGLFEPPQSATRFAVLACKIFSIDTILPIPNQMWHHKLKIPPKSIKTIKRLISGHDYSNFRLHKTKTIEISMGRSRGTVINPNDIITCS